MSQSKRLRLKNDVQSDTKGTPSTELKRLVQTSFGSQRVKFSWKVSDWRMGLPNIKADSLHRLSSPLLESSGSKWRLGLTFESDNIGRLCLTAILRLEEYPEKVMVLGSLGIEGVQQEEINEIICSENSRKMSPQPIFYHSRGFSLSLPYNLMGNSSELRTDDIPTEGMKNDIVVFADFQYSVNRMTEMSNVVLSEPESSTRSVDDSKHQKDVLGKALGSLLISGMESDVTISIQGNHIPAHRAILASRSPVFQAMIGKTDNKQKVLHFDNDCDDIGAWNEFLTFIYTGEVSANARELLDMGNALFILQKKFEVDSLSDHLTARFISIMNYETVLDVLEMAFQHQVTPLITKGTQELKKHLSRLRKEKRLELLSFVQRHSEITELLVDLDS